MATKRKTFDERIELQKQRIEKDEKDLQKIIVARQKDTEAKIMKNLDNPERTERTHRLIQVGALAEKYFRHENGTLSEFERLLNQLVEEPNVKIIIQLHEEKRNRMNEELKKKPENNNTDVSQNEKDNNINLNKTETVDNNIDVPEIENVGNNIDVKTESNNKEKIDYDLLADVTKRMEE